MQNVWKKRKYSHPWPHLSVPIRGHTQAVAVPVVTHRVTRIVSLSSLQKVTSPKSWFSEYTYLLARHMWTSCTRRNICRDYAWRNCACVCQGSPHRLVVEASVSLQMRAVLCEWRRICSTEYLLTFEYLWDVLEYSIKTCTETSATGSKQLLKISSRSFSQHNMNGNTALWWDHECDWIQLKGSTMLHS